MELPPTLHLPKGKMKEYIAGAKREVYLVFVTGYLLAFGRVIEKESGAHGFSVDEMTKNFFFW